MKKLGLRYYNAEIHKAAFILPQFAVEVCFATTVTGEACYIHVLHSCGRCWHKVAFIVLKVAALVFNNSESNVKQYVRADIV